MKLSRALILVATLLVSACTSELTAAGSAPAPPEEGAARYRLVAVPLEEASPPIPERGPLPFRLRAPGSAEARLVDLNGELIRSAPANGTIFGFRTSPNRQWVLLDFGDAEYAVASVDGLKDIARPPVRPDAPTDATGLSWRILDDDRLIGSAELPSLEPTQGLTASEVEGLTPRGTLVYLYTIATGVVTPVEIDDSVPSPSLSPTIRMGTLPSGPIRGWTYWE